MKKLSRLNIGAGRSARQAGVINADIYPGPNVDIVFDANKPWPLADNSIGAVHAHHSLEHLADPFNFFREAWRVLAPSGVSNLYVNMPYGASDAALADLTHLKSYFPASFCCFQPGYNDWSRNPQHDTWQNYFSIQEVRCMVDPALRWLLKPVIRRFGLRALRFIWNSLSELQVIMRALKTEQEVAQWKAFGNQGGVVPVTFAMLVHQYEGRELRPGEPMVLRFFGLSSDTYVHREA